MQARAAQRRPGQGRVGDAMYPMYVLAGLVLVLVVESGRGSSAVWDVLWGRLGEMGLY